MELLTLKNKSSLKEKALSQVHSIKEEHRLDLEYPIIADIGANIGYYSESFLQYYPNSIVHAYEPHPDHVKELIKIKQNRFIIHPYGLFNSDGEFSIGMKSDGRMNNGTFGIFDNQHAIKVPFKNANNEPIRPHLVKIDVEGSESFILECIDFFSVTKAILIEMVYNDDFGMNQQIVQNLKALGFNKNFQLGKNDYLWLRD